MRHFKGFLIIGACLLLGACGVKPGEVSPPEGAEGSAYPRTYPDLKTDPKPQEK